MKLLQPSADIYVPSSLSPEAALSRTTHLCIAAHQDDIEIMAYSGIAECYGRADRWFSGVVLTDGGGSPRQGPYAAFSDEQMKEVRRQEQRKAAQLGDYSIQLQLAYPSAAVKTPRHPGLQADLATLFAHCRPEVVYLHQPADKHDTHVAALLRSLEALRSLPPERRPVRVLGCEVWRDLDWLPDADKCALDSGQRPHLAAALLGVFDSQIAGGKRYDLATLGRRCAHATFHTSHATDRLNGITWALDLTPLVRDDGLDVASFISNYIERLKADTCDRLARFSAQS